MDWEPNREHTRINYSFLDKVNVSKAQGDQNNIHPIIKNTTSIALRLMEIPHECRLVFLFPNRLQCAKWLSFLFALNIMKNDFYKNASNAGKFSSGQKMKIGKYIVEYVSEEIYNKQIPMIHVRCSDGNYKILLNRKIEFQPVDTSRKLSSLRNVSMVCNSCPSNDCQLDKILGIQTMGNMTLFKDSIALITKIKSMRSFLGEYKINGIDIGELLLVGKIDYNGQVKIMNPGQFDATPPLLIAPDLYSLNKCLEKKQNNVRLVLIENISDITENLQTFDDSVQEKRIPTIAIGDLMDVEKVYHLKDRGYKVWQWKKDNLPENCQVSLTDKDTPFGAIERTIHNFKNREILQEVCNSPIIELLVEKALSLESPVDQNSVLKPAYYMLWKLLNRVTRMIRIPEDAFWQEFSEQLSAILEKFYDQRIWLNQDVIDSIESIKEMIPEIAQNRLCMANSKTARLEKLLDQEINGEKVGVIVQSYEEKERTRNYWNTRLSEQFSSNNISFMTLSELLHSPTTELPDGIFVCGWLNTVNIEKLIYRNLFQRLTFLFFPFEKTWFRRAIKKWNKEKYTSNDNKDIIKLSGLLDIVDETLEEAADEILESKLESDFDIQRFELKISDFKYSNYYESSEPLDEMVQAKLVIFGDEDFIFTTETHRFIVVNSLLDEEIVDKKIKKSAVEELKMGDFVLFTDSDRDIIREIARMAMEDQDLGEMIDLSESWKVALKGKYVALGYDLESLINHLRQAGCNRHSATIRTWILDDHVIGPNEDQDLECIANSCGFDQLKRNLSKVRNAISKVRGAHQQASSVLTKELINRLPSILNEKIEYSADVFEDSINFQLGDYGDVAILRVREIIDGWKPISSKKVNRLITQRNKQ